MARQNSKSVESVSHHVPALQRGLALLEALATRPRGATQVELAGELHLPQTAVHRIAVALEELGYVQRVPGTRTLRVTQKVLLLGQPYSGSRSLIESCLPAMREILSLTNETTQLCVLAGSKCVIIEQLASRHPFKYVVDLGSQAPVQCCAPGKAILASLEERSLEPVLADIDFHRHTANSITSLRGLRRELAVTRERGYAIDRAEHFEGIHCIAAPLRDAHGHAFAAITIAGPSTRIPENCFQEWGEAIAAIAADAALAFLL
jgi:DNA-binding IclR family transcriptional regulator